MTIEDLYQNLGGDFTKVCGRLPGRRFLERFLPRYLTDDSAEALFAALKAGDSGESFRLAQALKGVAGNLGFGDLEEAVTRLAQVLRAGKVTPEALRLGETVEYRHQAVVKAIRLYLSEKQE